MKSIWFRAMVMSILIFSFLFVIGCNTTVREDLNQSLDQGSLNKESAENNISDTNNLNGQLNNSNIECTPRWRCISSRFKAYQLANCSFVSRLECPLGCFNDSCRVGETCTPGFGCVNDHIKGYQMENCQWTSETNCEWKCENAECIERPENYTENESVATSVSNAPAPNPGRSLSIGGMDNITVEGVEHSVSIYAIDPTQVRITVDDLRSDWATEGSTITFSNGVTLVIKEILFQSFSGGQRKVVYTVG